ncbi:MAG TPA: amidase [Acidobacteriaceae bacterium]
MQKSDDKQAPPSPAAAPPAPDRVSRRHFLAAATAAAALTATGSPQTPTTTTPGAPPAFGTSPAVGPLVTAQTFAAAEDLVQLHLTSRDRAQAASNWRQSMAPLLERRTGPRTLAIPADTAPASVWNPVLPGVPLPERARRHDFLPTANSHTPLPRSPDEIAFAPLTALRGWIERRELSSERLTTLYLDRLRRYNPQLRCVITLTPELAIAQARRADAELASGHNRGPLHGIPWGAKDLLDTAHIPTTYGAEPFRTRVPAADATVVARLDAAGAVLLAKLSLGALALNDIWFGGQTMNPWNLDEGASGSSAGPGAAVAAGLVGFAIGSETGGSIVSPSMRCGVTGLRPTYGRVPRTGAMTLCWSLDKLGPMTRGVEDGILVLQAIEGPDRGDAASVRAPLDFVADQPVAGLKVGYFPRWMEEAPATPVDRAVLAKLPTLGIQTVEVALPDWPYDCLQLILFAEGAAAFEELTLSHQLDQLKMQVPDAWPNSFRQARFLSAVDLVQAERMRRMVALEMARVLGQVDLLLVPSLRDEMLTISNATGHPSLTLRAGFVQVQEARSDWAPDPAHPLPRFNPPRRVPHGVTLIGQLFDEGTLVRVGMAIEQAMGAATERPPAFAG